MTEHVVVYGRGSQPIRTVPQDRMGRPVVVSSPTYGIDDMAKPDGDPARAVVAHGTTATVDGTTTTLSAAAGPGQADPRKLSVASVTGFVVGRHYIASKADGQAEVFELSRVDAGGLALYARYGLRRTFAAADTVRGVELAGTFPSGTADDEESVKTGGGPYRVQWRWTDDGRAEQLDELVWVRRSSRAPIATVDEVLRRYPTAAKWARDEFSIEDALQSAHDDYYAHMMAARVDPAYFFSGPVGGIAVVNRALYYLNLWRNTDGSRDMADLFRAEYQQHLDAVRMGQPGQHAAEVDPDTDTTSRGPDRTGRSLFIAT